MFFHICIWHKLILLPLIKVKSVKFSLFISLTESTSSLFYRLECGENGGYPPTKNGDIRSLLCA